METSKTQIKEQNESMASDAKNIAVIAYLTIIGLIVAFVMNQDKKLPFAQYHIVQSLGLAITGLSLMIIGMIPLLGWLISMIGSLVIIYMWIVGLINAINEKQKPVPILGAHYEKWFSNLLK